MVQKNNTAPCRRSAYREPVYSVLFKL